MLVSVLLTVGCSRRQWTHQCCIPQLTAEASKRLSCDECHYYLGRPALPESVPCRTSAGRRAGFPFARFRHEFRPIVVSVKSVAGGKSYFIRYAVMGRNDTWPVDDGSGSHDPETHHGFRSDVHHDVRVSGLDARAIKKNSRIVTIGRKEVAPK
jgi:hypothetical protein